MDEELVLNFLPRCSLRSKLTVVVSNTICDPGGSAAALTAQLEGTSHGRWDWVRGRFAHAQVRAHLRYVPDFFVCLFLPL